MTRRSLQLLAWLAFLVLVAVGGGLAVYVRGWQGAMAAGAGGLLALLMIGESLWRRGPRGAPASWPRALAALLPLWVHLAAGGDALGGHAARLGFGPPPAVLIGNDTDAAPVGGVLRVAWSHASAPIGREPAPAIEVPAEARPFSPLTVLELWHPRRHPDIEAVEVLAQLMPADAESLQRIRFSPQDRPIRGIAYRHLVTCCAADAVAIAVALVGAGPPPGEGWYRIRGRWLRPAAPGEAPGIAVESLLPAPAPRDPYLHP